MAAPPAPAALVAPVSADESDMALIGRLSSGRLWRALWLAFMPADAVRAVVDRPGAVDAVDEREAKARRDELEAPGGSVADEPFLTRRAELSGAFTGASPASDVLESDARELAVLPSSEGLDEGPAAVAAVDVVACGAVDERPVRSGLGTALPAPEAAAADGLGLTGSPVRARTGSGVVGVVNATIFSGLPPDGSGRRVAVLDLSGSVDDGGGTWVPLTGRPRPMVEAAVARLVGGAATFCREVEGVGAVETWRGAAVAVVASDAADRVAVPSDVDDSAGERSGAGAALETGGAPGTSDGGTAGAVFGPPAGRGCCWSFSRVAGSSAALPEGFGPAAGGPPPPRRAKNARMRPSLRARSVVRRGCGGGPGEGGRWAESWLRRLELELGERVEGEGRAVGGGAGVGGR